MFYRRIPHYPTQLWLLFWGTLTGSIGQSMVWPFLTITIRERTDVALTTVTLLFTLQSIAGFGATTVIGPLMDRFGRRKPMIAGLICSGLVLLAMSRATELWHWAILLPAYGMVNTAFRVGSYAMVADLVPLERRAGVYALLRMGDNFGIVLGPALGGLLVSIGYTLSYAAAASTQFILAIFVFRIVRETLARDGTHQTVKEQSGYRFMLRDQKFMRIWGLYILSQIASSMVFVLLGVYVKENYSISEDRFGLIIGTNAAMVVIFQYGFTRKSTQHAALPVMAGGGLLYTLGMFVFALSRSFPTFLLGMVIFTCGEMLLIPTATALVANMAPPDMRARYMGVFSLSFRVAQGIGPVMGGVLSDTIAPAATWFGGMVFCALSAAGFLVLYGRRSLSSADHTSIPQPQSEGVIE